jgi:hypothetical protein
MTRYPWICLISRGNHAHHPPYPTRLPKDIADAVVNAIKQGDALTLTPRMSHLCYAYTQHMHNINFLVRFPFSESFAYLQRTFNTSILDQIHTSLVCADRLQALIRAERLRQYPEGTHIAGIDFAYA